MSKKIYQISNENTSPAGTELLVLGSPTGNLSQKITLRNLAKYIAKYPTVKDYGAVGDGVTDDSAAFEAALAVNKGVIVPGTNGEQYKINNFITVTMGQTDKMRALIGVGQPTILQNNKNGLFDLSGGYEFADDINSITTTAVALQESGESSPGNSYVSVIVLPSARTFKRGDVVKVISDDKISSVNSNIVYRGEYAVVAKDSTGTSVTLNGILKDTYTTTPRLVKLYNNKFIITGINFECTTALEATMGTTYMAAISLRLMQNALVRDCRFKNIYGRGLFISSLHTVVDNCQFVNLNNRPSKSQYGYGIDDSGTGTMVMNCTGINTRHVYTTNSFEVYSPFHVDRYGPSRDCVITNCHGIGNQVAAFDTHSTSDNIQFINCTANGSYSGASSGGNGFTARGKNVQFTNCVVDGCQVGFYVAVFEGCRISHCKTLNVNGYAITVAHDVSSVETGLTPDYKNIFIDNCYFESSKYTNGAISQAILIGTTGQTFRNVRISDTYIKMFGSVASSYFIQLWATELFTENIVLDYSEYTANAGLYGFGLKDNTSKLIANNTTYYGKSSVGDIISAIGPSSCTSPVRLFNTKFYHDTDAPANVMHSSLTKGYIEYSQDVGGTLGGSRYLSFATFGGLNVHNGKYLDMSYTIAFTGTHGGSTIADLENGVYPGQTILLVNKSTNTVTIGTPSTTVASGANKRVQWNGTTWDVLT